MGRISEMKKVHSTLIVFMLAAFFGFCSRAQKAALATDLVSYVNFVTLNAEVSYPVARHWSVNAGFRYNPFTFNLGEGKEDVRNKQQSYSAGVRFWPWNVFSGW